MRATRWPRNRAGPWPHPLKSPYLREEHVCGGGHPLDETPPPNSCSRLQRPRIHHHHTSAHKPPAHTSPQRPGHRRSLSRSSRYPKAAPPESPPLPRRRLTIGREPCGPGKRRRYRSRRAWQERQGIPRRQQQHCDYRSHQRYRKHLLGGLDGALPVVGGVGHHEAKLEEPLRSAGEIRSRRHLTEEESESRGRHSARGREGPITL